jgi:hypothetical protein
MTKTVSEFRSSKETRTGRKTEASDFGFPSGFDFRIFEFLWMLALGAWMFPSPYQLERISF